MEHKKVNATASAILARMRDENKAWFTTTQVYEAFPQMARSTLRTHLQLMCEGGLIFRIKKETYWIIPYEMESDTYMPSWHLLAEPLAGLPYYIGYYSALQLHGLITQPSLKEQIVVNRKMSSYATTVKDITFQYIKHSDEHFYGYKRQWIDDYNRVFVSDLEKTFVDCLFMPHYAGGIIEIAKALYMSQDKLNYELLLQYIIQMNSKAVVKRLGYLLEIMEIDNPIINQLQAMKSSALTPLDTEVPASGTSTSRWKIIQNVDTQTIKNAIFT